MDHIKIGDTVRLKADLKKRHNIGTITGIQSNFRGCQTGVMAKVSCYPNWIDSAWVVEVIK